MDCTQLHVSLTYHVWTVAHFFPKQTEVINLCKITMDLLYFWDVSDSNIWKKKSAEVQLIHAEQMSLYNFIILRKKTMDTDED